MNIDFQQNNFKDPYICRFDIDWNDPGSFFTNAERSLCMNEILNRTTFSPNDEITKKFGKNLTVYT